MILIYIVAFIAIATIIGVLVWFALQDQNIVCNSNGCTGDCSQGRRCTCAPSLETQRKHQLEDEFNNANWPFPVNRP